MGHPVISKQIVSTHQHDRDAETTPSPGATHSNLFYWTSSHHHWAQINPILYIIYLKLAKVTVTTAARHRNVTKPWRRRVSSSEMAVLYLG